MCVCMAHVWRGQISEVGSLFLPCRSQDQTQVIMLGGSCLYSPNISLAPGTIFLGQFDSTRASTILYLNCYCIYNWVVRAVTSRCLKKEKNVKMWKVGEKEKGGRERAPSRLLTWRRYLSDNGRDSSQLGRWHLSEILVSTAGLDPASELAILHHHLSTPGVHSLSETHPSWSEWPPHSTALVNSAPVLSFLGAQCRRSLMKHPCLLPVGQAYAISH